jgi:hypothetical protein
MAELPRAAFLPDRSVRFAAALLPATARDRYEREFLSELFGRSTWQQTRYAVDILVHTASLRIAVRQDGHAPDTITTTHPRAPLLCRLRRHRWVTKSTNDGGRYQQCRRCGKDRTEVDDNDFGGKVAGAAIAGLAGGLGGSGGGGGGGGG